MLKNLTAFYNVTYNSETINQNANENLINRLANRGMYSMKQSFLYDLILTF